LYTISQIVELVSIQASDWAPERVLSVINEVAFEMLRGNVGAAEFIDIPTGLPYMLETVAGTLFYVMPENCRKIQDVRIRASSMTPSYTNRFSYQERSYLGEAWYSILNVKTYPKRPARPTDTNGAILVFPVDPGTTTGLFYVPYWADPPAITSVNSELHILPEHQNLLVEGVVKRVQAYQYGKFDDYDVWREKMRSEVWNEANWNPPMSNFSSKRPC